MQFREVESVLAHLIGVFPEKRPRFQARLKQFQRLKFPEGANAGKTARADYRAEQVFKLAMALELLQVGITPERAINYAQSWWPKIRKGLIHARIRQAPTAVLFFPKDFGGLTESDDSEQVAWTSSGGALMTIDLANAQDTMETASILAHQPRTVIINLSRIWHEIMDSDVLSEEARAEMIADVDDWENNASFVDGMV